MHEHLPATPVAQGKGVLFSALAPLRAFGRYARQMRCWLVGLRDEAHAKDTGDTMLPPARLRYRVDGQPGIQTYLARGRFTFEHLDGALQTLGKQLSDFGRVLDWGCGCGRTMRWFQSLAQAAELHGSDTDAEAIEWAQRHLPFASFTVAPPLPPLDYPDACFDLVYGVSVLTHLDEERQWGWLAELSRVTQPGGVVLLSIHAACTWRRLSRAQRARLLREGFLFVHTDSWKGIFPVWYQDAYHTRAYVEEHFAQDFELVDFMPEGMTNTQDLVVLRRRS